MIIGCFRVPVRRSLLLLVLGVVCLCWSALPGPVRQAQAQEQAPGIAVSDPFTVRAVHVDATGSNTVAAREAARLDGERRALRTVLERLATPADLERLSKLSDVQITALVRDFEVAHERSSATRYLADYTFRFRRKEVTRLLQNAGIAYAETPSRPVVVVPLLKVGDRAVLWEDPNPWREAWANRHGASGLVPLIVPLGDAGDVAAIAAEQAAAADVNAFAVLAGHYGTNNVLLAQAVLSGEGDSQTLATSITRYTDGQPQKRLEGSYHPAPGETAAQMMARAVADAAHAVEFGWKNENALRFDRVGTLTVSIPLNSLSDWIFLRGRLVGIPTLRSSDLTALTRQNAEITLHYVGDLDRLRTALAERGLDLMEGNPDWILQPRAPAAGMP
jgi:hypothetical protein